MLLSALVSEGLRSLPTDLRVALSRLVHGDAGPGRWWSASADRLVGRSGPRAFLTAHALADVRRSSELRAEIEAALRQAGASPVRLPDGMGASSRLAVEPTDLPTLAAVLATQPDARAWNLTVTRPLQVIRRSAHQAKRVIRSNTTVVRVGPRYRAVDGTRLILGGLCEVQIEVWDRLAGGELRADGDPHREGTRVPRVTPERLPYLDADHWEQLASTGTAEAAAFTLPSLFEFNGPIDAVYTWVDGDDKDWLARKDAAAGRDSDAVHHTSSSRARFASRDELRYSLRSLETFAPWIRHVYLVTDQQRPEWLDVDNPRITVVDHREIFSDPSVLPVFNSHAIESQLHHIDGLSEHYLYMNDDVMFGRPVGPAGFFEGNGMPRFFVSSATLDVSPASSRDLPVLSAAKRNARVIADRFGRSVTQKFQHTPHPQSRAVLRELEGEYPDLFAEVSASKFRHPDDVSVASSLHHTYAHARGLAVPGRLKYAYINVAEADAALRLTGLMRKRDRDVFCLNDVDVSHTDNDAAARNLAQFLEHYFPVRSAFELAEGEE